MVKLFWDRMNLRWTSEKLGEWSSINKIVYLIFPVIIYFLVGDIVEVLLWGLLNVLAKGASEGTLEMLSRNSYTLNGLIFAAGALVSVLIIKKAAISEITYVKEGEETPKLDAVKVIVLIVVGLAASIGLNYLFNLTGLNHMSESYDQVKEAQYGVNFACGIILYGVISPVVEEIIFRGILFNRMKRIFPVKLSMVVSAVLFGLFHANLVQGLYGFLMGLLIVYFYEKYKNFLAPLILHVVANVGVYVLTYTIWR